MEFLTNHLFGQVEGEFASESVDIEDDPPKKLW